MIILLINYYYCCYCCGDTTKLYAKTLEYCYYYWDINIIMKKIDKI